MFVLQHSSRPIKIVKWKVTAGDSVSTGKVIFTYCVDGADKAEQRKFKSTKTGTVRRLLAQEGAIVNKRYVRQFEFGRENCLTINLVICDIITLSVPIPSEWPNDSVHIRF